MDKLCVRTRAHKRIKGVIALEHMIWINCVRMCAHGLDGVYVYMWAHGTDKLSDCVWSDDMDKLCAWECTVGVDRLCASTWTYHNGIDILCAPIWAHGMEIVLITSRNKKVYTFVSTWRDLSEERNRYIWEHTVSILLPHGFSYYVPTRDKHNWQCKINIIIRYCTPYKLKWNGVNTT